MLSIDWCEGNVTVTQHILYYICKQVQSSNQWRSRQIEVNILIKRLELLIQYTRNQWGKSRLYCVEVFIILTKALGFSTKSFNSTLPEIILFGFVWKGHDIESLIKSHNFTFTTLILLVWDRQWLPLSLSLSLFLPLFL